MRSFGLSFITALLFLAVFRIGPVYADEPDTAQAPDYHFTLEAEQPEQEAKTPPTMSEKLAQLNRASTGELDDRRVLDRTAPLAR